MASHNDKEDYDLKREECLKSLGLIIFRVSDLRIKHDLENVFKDLESFIVENFGINK
jgi:very-short-patch-repair endonuclease